MKPQYIALIKDTFYKELRSKTLIFIFLATTASIVLGHLILTAFNNDLNGAGGVNSIGLAGVNVLSINFRILNSISFIIATVFGVSVFRSDFENNIIYQYLSFPISRTEYFFSRIIGTWLLVMAYYAYAYLLSAILFSLAFKTFILTPMHFLSFFILGVYLLLVIFISIFFSLIMNKIGALFATFATCIAAAISYGVYSVLPLSETFSQMSFFKLTGLVVYYLFPRISFLDAISSALLLDGKLEINLWQQSVHLIVISGVYVYLANRLVKRKDF